MLAIKSLPLSTSTIPNTQNPQAFPLKLFWREPTRGPLLASSPCCLFFFPEIAVRRLACYYRALPAVALSPDPRHSIRAHNRTSLPACACSWGNGCLNRALFHGTSTRGTKPLPWPHDSAPTALERTYHITSDFKLLSCHPASVLSQFQGSAVRQG